MPKAIPNEAETLKTEVESELRMKAMLEHSIEDLQKTVNALEAQLDQPDNGDGTIENTFQFYGREPKVEVNDQLERQCVWLRDKVEAAKNQTTEGMTALLADLDLDALSENQLLRYLKQLEKDRNSIYNEMRDTEWKLDQESKSFHKYNETRKAYMTEITDAMLNLEALRHKMKAMEMSECGSIAKCPRHLKYLNISPDQRVIDPRRGPIKKTAAVRSLPKMEDLTPDENKEEPEALTENPVNPE